MLMASTKMPVNGDTVTLNCTSSANPAANYTFYQVIGSNETMVQSNSVSGIFTVSSINYVDFGGYKVSYKCMPSNVLGNGPAKNVQLDIQGMIVNLFIILH